VAGERIQVRTRGQLNRNLRRALSDGTSPTSSTWLMPDKSATPDCREPRSAPSLKTPDEGARLAEP